MIDKVFWNKVVEKWSKRKDQDGKEPPIKPIIIEEDGESDDQNIRDIMDDLDDLFD